MMTTQKEWFENWFDSKYYPILYGNRDVEEASLFVTNLVKFLRPPDHSKIADIACGEGRFAQQLAGYGHEVVGIDLSGQRIEKAKELENDHLRFYVHDMRFPFYINYFHYAFNFFTSFGYFETHRDNQMAAKSFAAALKQGGTLVVDYFNEQVVEDSLVPMESITRGDYTFHIKRYLEAGKIVKEIELTDEDGLAHHFQERVSAFELADFQKLFEDAGMKLKQHFGDYQLNAFSKATSPRLIMIFEKN